MYSYKNYVIAFCILAMTLGCQDITKPKKPENFIAKKDMEEIMYTSALLNAARGNNLGQMAQTGIKPEAYIEEKFGVDSTTYADNIAYYTTDIDEFLEMNERISKRLIKLHNEKDSLHKIDKAIKDSIKKTNAKTIGLDTTKVDSIAMPVLKYTSKTDSMVQNHKKLVKEKAAKKIKNRASIVKDSLELVKDGL